MKYSIPLNKLNKLKKIINRYNKKGANIIFNIGDEVIENGMLFVNDAIHHCSYEEPIKVTCREVFVDGSYVINGWQFVGTIEFTELGNIIRLADSSFEGKVPVKYLHTPKICEHCGKIRNRKDTYLIYNIDSGEFKQVGSTCLLDYTKGLDADACADIMSCLTKVVELSNFDCDEDSFYGNGYDSTGYGLSRKMVLPIAYAYVKQYGYTRMENGCGTASDILAMIWHGLKDEELQRRYESLIMPSDKELEEINNFAQTHLNDDFGYMRNASIAWLKNSIEYRDLSLVASFVYTFLKEMKKQEEQQLRVNSANNTWVGNIGDRVTIKVASCRCLFSNTIEVAWHTYVSTYMYEIKDNEGHVFIWKTSKSITEREDENGYHSFHATPKEIVATIKGHDTFRGIKQTTLTRGKVTKSEEVK